MDTLSNHYVKKICSFCDSKDLNFVKYTYSNGVVHIRQQCFNCGLVHPDTFKRADFDFDSLPEMNEELRVKFYEKLKERSERKTKIYYKKVEIHSEGYYEYLKSEDWRNKRMKTLLRDNMKCRCCGEKATQVHHITYDNLGFEKDIDLLSVCAECHKKIHSEEVFDTVYLINYKPHLSAKFNQLKICEHGVLYNKDFYNGFNQDVCMYCETCLELFCDDINDYLVYVTNRLNKLKNEKL